MRNRTIAVAAVLLVSAVVPATALGATARTDATSATSADGETYTGTHVSVETTGEALVEYRVDNETAMEAVRVQSRDAVETSLLVETDLAAVTDIAGAAVSVESRTDARAELDAESGATVTAHDNGHGSLVVHADDGGQYVTVGLGAAADPEQESESRVTYTTDAGATATAMVVGDGRVTVNEDGNLTASLDEDARLVVRTYPDGRTEADAETEAQVVDGTAAASVYVLAADDADAGDDESDSGVQGGVDANATAVSTVTYDDRTSVTVTEQAEGRVEMNVTRTAHDGRVVAVHTDEEVVADNVTVQVDGAAATRVDSHAALEAAAEGDTGPAYTVESSGGAAAESTVLVGVDHFSTRQVTVTGDAEASADAGTSADGTDDTSGDQDGDADKSTDSDGSTERDSDDDESSEGDSDDSDESDDSNESSEGDGDSSDGSEGDSDDSSGDEDTDDSEDDGGLPLGPLAVAASVVATAVGVLVLG